MRKTILFTVSVLVLILVGLTLDWGRKAEAPASLPIEQATTTNNGLPILVSFPKEGDTVTSPISITGSARGNWFFEASFPLKLVDYDGNTIVESYATADGEWMTTDFVPFHSELSYPSSAAGQAILVLSKDNPSGLPEFDQSIFIPVILK